jgi:hypothetical protein
LVTAGEIKEERASDIFEAWRGRLIRERELKDLLNDGLATGDGLT